MRPNKYDPYVCLIVLALFLYSFFLSDWKVTYVYEDLTPQYRFPYLMTELEYPVAVIIAPLVFLLVFSLYLWRYELIPVNRHWVKEKIQTAIREWLKSIKSD